MIKEENGLSIIIVHSTQKEIEHPNTPSWVKKKAVRFIYTQPLSLNSEESFLLKNIEITLAGSGKRENIVQDSLHIFEAQKYGSYFVTTDDRLLKKAYEIQKLCRVKILLPSEFLTIVQHHLQGSEMSEKKEVKPNRASMTPMSGGDVQTVSYKGYQIRPAPMQVLNNLRWKPNVIIFHDKGGEIVERQFFSPNTFESKEEAIQACIEFGRQIIDGQIPNCTVRDI